MRIDFTLFWLLAMGLAISAAAGCAGAASGSGETGWRPLFNGRDLSGWDTYLAPPSPEAPPLGLNHDPRKVFSVVTADGAPAIHISGEIYGALTTREEFKNFHLRVECKWGEKRWPPRASAGRDSGILYNCIAPHGAGSDAWMRSIECNIMEKGCGQWWSVGGTVIEVEGVRVDAAMEPRVPYRKESPGEQLILYKKGASRITAASSDGITPAMDYEKPRGEWNVVEVMCLGSDALHLVNGRVVMALSNARLSADGPPVPLDHGKIQLQSEGAEIYYRKVEIRPLQAWPAELEPAAPPAPPQADGFLSLLDPEQIGGWTQCGPGGFKVENGVATAQGGMGLWYYKRRPFADFVFECEFVQEQPGADSGVFLRFPDPGDDPWIAVNQGYEVELGDPNPQPYKGGTGSIYSFQGPAAVPLKPAGEWNALEITGRGQEYQVRMNGSLINTYTGQRRIQGYVGLQNYNDGKTFRYRKVRIRELPTR